MRPLICLLPALVAAPGVCPAGNLYFQGFETDTSGWYIDSGGDGNGSITRTPSGGGNLHLTAFDGAYYAEVHNNTNAYQAGYGTGGYSLFGNPVSAPPYPGSPFSQEITVYVNVNTAAPTVPATPAFWIDESPSSTSPNDVMNNGGTGYGGEHNFRLSYTGSSVLVGVDGGTPIATLVTSGWYTFQMIYSKGATATSLAMTTLNIYDAHGDLLGTDMTLDNSDGDPLESQYLAGPGYLWLTVWQNGFSNDLLGIDDVRADTLSSVPEPASFAMLGGGLVPLALLAIPRRKRGARLRAAS